VPAEAALDDSGVGISVSIKRLFELCCLIEKFATGRVIKIANQADAYVSFKCRLFLQFSRLVISKCFSIAATA
jgi:hypothetical protein